MLSQLSAQPILHTCRADAVPDAYRRYLVNSLRETFDYNDLNRDGKLTLGEFIRFMEAADENITAEEAQIGFDEIDTDRDGGINFDEFHTWWTQA